MKILISSLLLIFLGCQIERPESSTTHRQDLPEEIKPSPAVDTSMKVLSYNVCWECMSNSSKGSAKKLGKKCTWTAKNGVSVTICALNIAEQIDKIGEYYRGSAKDKYDFVALQEAFNWNNLRKITSSLKDMQYSEVMRGNYKSLLTFYDKEKYNLLQKVSGGFLDNDRPFDILIFKEGIIFINAHAPHKFTREAIEAKLSEALMKSVPDLELLKSYRIIVAGDFNDNKNNFWLQQVNNNPFVPFRNANILTPVYAAREPDKTCCSTEVPLPNLLQRQSDFIMDSVKPKNYNLGVPSNYDYKTPKSDHLPLIYTAS